jgi:hypothetical protein
MEPPPSLLLPSKQYTDLKVVLKINKEIQEILQSVGVRQGNNMAPVLFLFLMSAAAETLEPVWRQASISILTVAHIPDNQLDTGCVWGHTPHMYTSRKLTAYEIYQLIYVNDGAFPFPTRAALIKGLTLMHSHLARFGLKVQRNGNPSKTECVFFPLPQFFDDIQPSTPTLTDNVDQPWLLYQKSSPIPENQHNANTTLCHSKTKRTKKEKKETQESAIQNKRERQV